MKKNYIKEFNIFLNKEKNAIKTIRKAKNRKKIQYKRQNKIIRKKYLFLLGLIIINFLLFFFFKNNSLIVKKEIIKVKEETYEHNISLHKNIEKDINEEYKDVQDFMNLVMNGTELYKNKIYYPTANPKISIVVTVYNGEPYLKTSLLSVQNQDFKDIEIVLVDDCSQDNSVNLIKELMKTEPRIVLYENKENKGMLYTKSKGLLLAKGKYVMTLDEDDIYVQKDAFSLLYAEAEKDNLDILGFVAVHSGSTISRDRPNYSDKKRIIYQPELSNLMYSINSFGRVKHFGGNLWNLFIRTDLIKKVIKQIDEKNMNIRTNRHDDLILFFLMTRTAKSIRYIDRLFYVLYHSWNKNDKIKFRMEKKFENEYNIRCLSFLNFLEILFKNTKNSFDDKKIAFHELETLYLHNECRNNKNITERAIEVCKLYLDNEFVSKEDKNKIKTFY